MGTSSSAAASGHLTFPTSQGSHGVKATERVGRALHKV